MNDLTANRIVFFILLVVLVLIVFTTNIILQGTLYDSLLGTVKNNSGNYNATKILLMFSAAVFAYFLLYWLFKTKSSSRKSLYRSQEKESD
jgi:thiosulfate reductase cytochrome b subunit